MAVYKLPLDDELDKDIIDWIASFPRNRKSEVVRQVLKSHINGAHIPAPSTPPSTPIPRKVEKEVEAPKKPINSRFSEYKDNMEIVAEKPTIDMSGLLE